MTQNELFIGSRMVTTAQGNRYRRCSLARQAGALTTACSTKKQSITVPNTCSLENSHSKQWQRFAQIGRGEEELLR
jgi:hypothetical protein